MNRLRKRESSPDLRSFSLNGYGYSPQTIANLASLSHPLASIPLNPTGS